MAALGDLKNLTEMVHDAGGSEESKNKPKMTSLKKLLPPTRSSLETWSRLPSTHWPMLFSIYNMVHMSCNNRFDTFLSIYFL